MRSLPLIVLLILGLMFTGCPEEPDPADIVGVLVVLNKSDDTAYLLDRETGERYASIQTGYQPHEVAISPDGGTAVITNYGTRDEPGNSLTVIDIAGAEQVKDIELGEYTLPHGIQFLDDTRVIVTAEGEQSVVIVNIDTEEVEDVFVTEQDISHMVAVTPDGNRAFVTNIGSGTVTVIDLNTGMVETHIETGEGAEGVAVSPDGEEVWVTNREDDTVTIISVETLEVIFEVPSPEFPIRAEFSPDGEHVVVTNARSGTMTVFDAEMRLRVGVVDLNEIAELADDPDRYFIEEFEDSVIPIGVVVGPDSRTAYVSASAADVVVVVDILNLDVLDVFEAGAEPDGIGWSPVMPE